MDFTKELEMVDFQDLFDRLTAYAVSRLHSVNIRLMDGKQPVDLVSDLLTKVLTGQRKAESATCSLDEFLFGCLKSDIDGFFRKEKIQWLSLVGDMAGESPSQDRVSSDLEAKKKFIFNQLQSVGADEDEIKVFSIWMEGIYKPKNVGIELERPAAEIYRIQRRLHKHLQKIHESAKAYL